MTKKLEAAIEVVSKVCGEFKGNLEDHTVIQGAMKIIEDALNLADGVKSAEQPENKKKEKIEV